MAKKIWKFNKEENAWGFINKCTKGHVLFTDGKTFAVATFSQFEQLQELGFSPVVYKHENDSYDNLEF